MRNAVPHFQPRAARHGIEAAPLVLALGVTGALAEEPSLNPEPSTLKGSWSARAKLEERGIAPFAVLTTEVWGNVSGGHWKIGIGIIS